MTDRNLHSQTYYKMTTASGAYRQATETVKILLEDKIYKKEEIDIEKFNQEAEAFLIKVGLAFAADAKKVIQQFWN